MGIPRLTQDISPHAESVALGRHQGWPGTKYVDQVVIDGPSLVYHVYSLLLKQHRAEPLSKRGSSRKHRDVLLAYSTITTAVLSLLDLLQELDIVVLRIFFDGGLPPTKQSTRLDRLEKARQQLENYRLLDPGSLLTDAQSLFGKHGKPGGNLWDTFAGTSSSSSVPIPPFIVPCVIERLQGDAKWNDVTEVVNGESDAYCASLAAQTGAAVLSNDSDLIVHDLGEHGCLINLQSLQLHSDQGKSRVLRGLSLSPANVGRGLGVSDIKLYAYQRSIDGQSTSPIIVQRTRTFDASEDHDCSYSKFLEDYTNLPFQVTRQAGFHLSGLDPRTSELVCNLHARIPLHLYLPVLFEDPSRDSSWMYGTELRQIAYCILARKTTYQADASEPRHVTEYSRRGRVIKDKLVTILTKEEMQDSVGTLVDNLQAHIQPDSSEPGLLLGFYSFAAQVVESIKFQDAKSCIVQVARLMSIDKQTLAKLTWDDIHVLANVQAVLYSLRMVKQICKWVGDQSTSVSLLTDMEQRLLQVLLDMPSIEKLFLDISQLRHKFNATPLAIRTEQHHKIGLVARSDMGSEKCDRLYPSNSPIEPKDHVPSSKAIKHRKRPAHHDSAGISGKSVKKTPQISAKMATNNPFNVLNDN